MNLRNALRLQAETCDALGSPFTARLLRLTSEHLSRGTVLTDRLFAWPGDISAGGASVPLRLMGALHGLVLDGADPGLAALYPPNPAPDDATLWRTVEAALSTHETRLQSWLDRPPQTNEIGRSAVLIAAGHWLAAETGRPMVLSELGASAGLNLNWDRFALQTPARTLGPDTPVLTLTPDWRGDAPSQAGPQIVERRGTDLTPLDPTDPAHVLRLTAYLWPDQPERLARTRAALSIATPLVDAEDAAPWLEKRLANAPKNHLHLIYHTVAWQYFPPETQARATRAIETQGARATADTPLAWLAMEADDESPGAGLTLRLWPGDRRLRLGRADFHGRWVDWQPRDAS